MEWKMRGGKRSVEEGCPEKAFHEITYSDPCSYAAYELGAWGLAYLQNKAGEGKVVGVFYPKLEELGWEGAFNEAFGMSSDAFYAEFETFLALPLEEQLEILPEL